MNKKLIAGILGIGILAGVGLFLLPEQPVGASEAQLEAQLLEAISVEQVEKFLLDGKYKHSPDTYKWDKYSWTIHAYENTEKGNGYRIFVYRQNQDETVDYRVVDVGGHSTEATTDWVRTSATTSPSKVNPL